MLRAFKSLSILSIVVTLIAGCAALGLQPANSADDRILYAQSVAIEAEKIAISQLNAGALSSDHGAQIQVAARAVMASTTQYFRAKAAGQPVNATSVLSAINAAYLVLVQFVGANAGGKST